MASWFSLFIHRYLFDFICTVTNSELFSINLPHYLPVCLQDTTLSLAADVGLSLPKCSTVDSLTVWVPLDHNNELCHLPQCPKSHSASWKLVYEWLSVGTYLFCSFCCLSLMLCNHKHLKIHSYKPNNSKKRFASLKQLSPPTNTLLTSLLQISCSCWNLPNPLQTLLPVVWCLAKNPKLCLNWRRAKRSWIMLLAE